MPPGQCGGCHRVPGTHVCVPYNQPEKTQSVGRPDPRPTNAYTMGVGETHMKFLHLADLHLGKRVNGFDMLEDQRFILDQILTLCDKHGAEAVVLAGDIYDTPVPPAAACTLLDWFLTQLATRKIPVLAVSGNHDSAERLDFASGLLAEQGVYIAGRFTGAPRQVVLHDRHGAIEFTLLPFVRAATVRHYLPDADITDYDSAVGAALAVCEPAAPRRVLVAHQMVVSGVCPPQLSGSETAPLTVGTVDSIDAARFAGFCYAALGHIHRAQRVGIDAVRYAGSPLCYHLDECGAQKSVTLVRIGKRGVEKIEPLPLTPRRAMRHLTGPLAKLVEHPTDTEDYIWATLTDPTPLPDAMAQLRAAYPNAMRLDYQPQGAAALPADMTQAVRGKPFAELFQDFFTKMNGRPLTTEEVLAVKKLREEASKIE